MVSSASATKALAVWSSMPSAFRLPAGVKAADKAVSSKTNPAIKTKPRRHVFFLLTPLAILSKNTSKRMTAMQQRSKPKITIRDIAKGCDVSVQTVSRVINNRPDVSPATRQKIESFISKSGYRPNAVARSLVSRRSQTLGVIIGYLWKRKPLPLPLNRPRSL